MRAELTVSFVALEVRAVPRRRSRTRRRGAARRSRCGCPRAAANSRRSCGASTKARLARGPAAPARDVAQGHATAACWCSAAARACRARCAWRGGGAARRRGPGDGCRRRREPGRRDRHASRAHLSTGVARHQLDDGAARLRRRSPSVRDSGRDEWAQRLWSTVRAAADIPGGGRRRRTQPAGAGSPSDCRRAGSSRRTREKPHACWASIRRAVQVDRLAQCASCTRATAR